MTRLNFSAGRLFATLMLALLLAASTAPIANDSIAFAQAVSGPDKPTQGSTPGGTTIGSSSDAELWRQIRQGNSGQVVGQDKSGGLLIQSNGQAWREIRNGPLPQYSAWAILGMLLLLSIFFALRGRVKISHGKSTRKIKRFGLIDRASHWLLASSFILLALTGLNLVFGKTLLLPLIGPEGFATITLTGKFIHNYIGFAFMVALAAVAILWVLDNIPNRHDLVWLLRGGGMLGGGHPPAKKFNAGQKIIFWVVIICGISISLSGWALLNPFSTTMMSDTFAISNSIFGTELATNLSPIHEQQLQTIWHSAMAVFMVVVILAHIYIGTIGMEGALDAMTSGDVDENWAMEHHSLWVKELDGKESAGSAKAQAAE